MLICYQIPCAILILSMQIKRGRRIQKWQNVEIPNVAIYTKWQHCHTNDDTSVFMKCLLRTST